MPSLEINHPIEQSYDNAAEMAEAQTGHQPRYYKLSWSGLQEIYYSFLAFTMIFTMTFTKWLHRDDACNSFLKSWQYIHDTLKSQMTFYSRRSQRQNQKNLPKE